MKQILSLLNRTQLWLMASLTLGLAPFWSEPHVVGKLRWVMGGATGMSGLDWMDLLMHLTPWLLLARALVVQSGSARAGKNPGNSR